jgi:GT2 family glycosyltransferase
MKNDMGRVSIVILNWNGIEVLPRFLPSVIANTPREVEIVVADNGSTDGSVELLRRDFPDVRVVTLDRNYGFAEGYNRALNALCALDGGAPVTEADGADGDATALRYATTPQALELRNCGGSHPHPLDPQLPGGGSRYYILLNSDVETPPGWCEPLIEMLDAHPDVGAVAPKILSWSEHSDGRETFEYAGAAGGFIDSLGYPFCRGRILNSVEPDNGQYNDSRDVFWASGACFACRADLFHSLGGFDGSFFAHQEEIDLCWRMQLAGWRIVVEPRSTVYHLGAGTLPPSPRKVYLNHRNNLAMLYKNLPAGRMQTVIFVRLLLDALAAAVYLLHGEVKNFSAVWHAHRDFFAMRREGLRTARRQIQSSHNKRPTGIYHGSILLAWLSGRRRFAQLTHL